MTRKRSTSALTKEREWRERHAAYLKRGRANLPPQPDPKTHPKEFHAWMRKYARTELTQEETALFADLNKLPKMKLKRKRDDIRWWAVIYPLLVYQDSRKRPVAAKEIILADYDLMTISLGKNPLDALRGSKNVELLRALLRVSHVEMVEMTDAERDELAKLSASKFYDSIREWRKRRKEMSPPAP
jgi:hypothetical protein